MDPQATWQRLLNAYTTQSWAEAKEAAEDLLAWLRGGGFPPLTHLSRPMDDAWNRAIAETACTFVILDRGCQGRSDGV
jgi:hypothetical protein